MVYYFYKQTDTNTTPKLVKTFPVLASIRPNNEYWKSVTTDTPIEKWDVFHVRGKINGVINNLLLDSGAYENFINPDFVKYLKAPVYYTGQDVSCVVGNGDKMTSVGQVILDVEVLGVKRKLRFYLLEPFGGACPLILSWTTIMSLAIIIDASSLIPRIHSAFNRLEHQKYLEWITQTTPETNSRVDSVWTPVDNVPKEIPSGARMPERGDTLPVNNEAVLTNEGVDANRASAPRYQTTKPMRGKTSDKMIALTRQHSYALLFDHSMEMKTSHFLTNIDQVTKCQHQPAQPPEPDVAAHGNRVHFHKSATKSVRERIEDILKSNGSLFVDDDLMLRPSKIPPVEIKLKEGAKPVASPLFRENLRARAIIRRQMGPLIANGTCVPGKSPWRCNTFLVSKKLAEHVDLSKLTPEQIEDKKHRPVHDFREINKRIEPDKYVLPRIDMVKERLLGRHFFTTLDCKKGYNQLRVTEASSQILTVYAGGQTLSYTRLPFGVSVAPLLFQRSLETVFHEFIHCDDPFLQIYVDDILIASRTEDEHIQHIKLVMDKLQEFDIQLHLDKCTFAANEITYLGCVFSFNSVRPVPNRMDAIKQIQLPKDRKGLRSFLGALNQFQDFIPNYRSIVHCLDRMTSKSEAFVWTEEKIKAFECAKLALTSDLIQTIFDPEKQHIIEVDASDWAMGALLKQVEYVDGQRMERIVECYSKAFSPAQRNYHTTEKEMLGVILAVKKWRNYLMFDNFTIRTDHHALCYLCRIGKTKDTIPANQRLMRWAVLLQGLTFDIMHISGVKHQAADCLSRCSFEKIDLKKLIEQEEKIRLANDLSLPSAFSSLSTLPCQYDEHVWIPASNASAELSEYEEAFSTSYENMRLAQLKDPFIARQISLLENGEKVNQKFVLIQGVLYFQKISKTPASGPIIGPLTKNQTKELEMNPDHWMRRHIVSSQVTLHRFVVPETHILTVLELCHDVPTAGHLGLTKTLARVQEQFWWFNQIHDVHEYVKSCPLCQKRNHKNRKEGLLHPQILEMPEHEIYPMHTLVMDQIEMPSIKTFQYSKIILAMDVTTRFLFTRPVKTLNSYEVCLLLDEISKFGKISNIVTDEASYFSSAQLNDYCINDKIILKHGVAYTPTTQGLAEKAVGTVKTMISKFIQEPTEVWLKVLPQLTIAYNTSIQPSTRHSPYFLLFGHNYGINKLGNLIMPRFSPKELQNESPEQFKDRMLAYWRQAISNLIDAGEKMARRENAKRTPVFYEVGEKVLLENPPQKTGPNLKVMRWDNGPFIVTRKLGSTVYEVVDIKGKLCVTNASHMKRFHLRSEIPRFIYLESLRDEIGITTEVHMMSNDLQEFLSNCIETYFVTSADSHFTPPRMSAEAEEKHLASVFPYELPSVKTLQQGPEPMHDGCQLTGADPATAIWRHKLYMSLVASHTSFDPSCYSSFAFDPDTNCHRHFNNNLVMAPPLSIHAEARQAQILRRGKLLAKWRKFVTSDATWTKHRRILAHVAWKVSESTFERGLKATEAFVLRELQSRMQGTSSTSILRCRQLMDEDMLRIDVDMLWFLSLGSLAIFKLIQEAERKIDPENTEPRIFDDVKGSYPCITCGDATGHKFHCAAQYNHDLASITAWNIYLLGYVRDPTSVPPTKPQNWKRDMRKPTPDLGQLLACEPEKKIGIVVGDVNDWSVAAEWSIEGKYLLNKINSYKEGKRILPDKDYLLLASMSTFEHVRSLDRKLFYQMRFSQRIMLHVKSSLKVSFRHELKQMAKDLGLPQLYVEDISEVLALDEMFAGFIKEMPRFVALSPRKHPPQSRFKVDDTTNHNLFKTFKKVAMVCNSFPVPAAFPFVRLQVPTGHFICTHRIYYGIAQSNELWTVFWDSLRGWEEGKDILDLKLMTEASLYHAVSDKMDHYLKKVHLRTNEGRALEKSDDAHNRLPQQLCTTIGLIGFRLASMVAIASPSVVNTFWNHNPRLLHLLHYNFAALRNEILKLPTTERQRRDVPFKIASLLRAFVKSMVKSVTANQTNGSSCFVLLLKPLLKYPRNETFLSRCVEVLTMVGSDSEVDQVKTFVQKLASYMVRGSYTDELAEKQHYFRFETVPTLKFVVAMLSLMELTHQAGVIDGENEDPNRYPKDLWKEILTLPSEGWQSKLDMAVDNCRGANHLLVVANSEGKITDDFSPKSKRLASFVAKFSQGPMTRMEMQVVKSTIRELYQACDPTMGWTRLSSVITNFLDENLPTKTALLQVPMFGWKDNATYNQLLKNPPLFEPKEIVIPDVGADFGLENQNKGSYHQEASPQAGPSGQKRMKVDGDYSDDDFQDDFDFSVDSFDTSDQ